jgi:hypothetical protein
VSNIKIISNFLLKPHRQLGLDQQSLWGFLGRSLKVIIWGTTQN